MIVDCSIVKIMETIRNKTVLLIGATGTIGSGIAKKLADSGANLYITGRDQNKLNELAETLKLSPDQALQLDITDESSIQNVMETFISRAGSPDIVVNAAGIGIIKPIESLSVAEFKRTIDINLTASFILLKFIIPVMKSAGKGLIIHIPGVLGKTPMAGAAAYAASKYGLNGMMKSIREELKRTNIRITQLFLGGVDSAFWDSIDLKVQREKMIVADEAAKAVWFLCQQPASGVVSEMVIQPFNHQAI